MSVALVVVSHSALVAQGCAEMARQMAPDVLVVPVGGLDGGLGTSVAAVADAVDGCLGDGLDVVVLTDLGSAVMAAETAVELLEADAAARVRTPDGPLVEGAVAAAVQAQLGSGPDEVARAATGAVPALGPVLPDGPGAGQGRGRSDVGVGTDAVTVTVTLRSPHGLHARPAALLARAVGATGVPVTVDGVNAASVLALMKLGARDGQELTVAGEGPGAGEAVAAVAELVRAGLADA
ncbi:dihydroxyacetone kinase phosphoryl donor subunit DhaM [Cellulomonas bogoriensis]|uniref:Phosphocarrier protein HPr n=1 Tax=Cellulomonas bogoriensis 69B4 = DSM 16987 TaxID=1386082 RepID=A0A0A0C0B2_9CELL|nr:dihydroxyacetone kinase phosphoryl donor subunit DhaM [Cellulomonas bogoriensis]KGM12844.1 PTS sugar transporter subunit IIA [Cellulomonas bogoriensis 69B4 = DSM 16987]